MNLKCLLSRRAIAACLAWLCVAGLARLAADSNVEIQSRLRDQLKYLASDELEGRGVGTAGLNKAADFMRNAFKSAGLDVSRVHGGAFQTFSMSARAELGSPNTLRFIAPDGKRTELVQDVDFRPCSFGGGGTISGELLFGGYAIESPRKNYRDFKDVDLKGKVVIVMRRTPRQGDPSGQFSPAHGDVSREADLRTKLSNAVAGGAAALLIVNDPYSIRKDVKDQEAVIRRLTSRVVESAEAFVAADPASPAGPEARKQLAESVARLKKAREGTGDGDPLMEFGYAGNGKEGSIPVVQLKAAACDRLLKAALGKTLADFEASIDRDLKPQSTRVAGWKAEGLTTIRRIPTEVKNVIGVLEGEGPHADETVVVGAHYDHLGRGGAGSLAGASKEIHNGADDNASGSVAIVELARRFAHRQKKLPRRLVFIAFTAEELGLIGSARYVKEPVFPLEKTVAMINLDMVGRLANEKLTVYGVGTSAWWKEPLERTAKAHHLHLIEKPEGFGPSDQSSFYAQKIPVLHFFTGSHPDYHRPTDDWEKINFPGMTSVIDVVEDVVASTAQSPRRPDYIAVKDRAQVERSGSRPYFGSIPDFSSEDSGYVISGVAPGGPADLAGLKGGDRIVEFGGRKVSGLDDFDLALRAFSAGDEVTVLVARGGKTVKLKVILGKPK